MENSEERSMKRKTFLTVVVVVLSAFVAMSCSLSGVKYYWDSDCEWYSNEPQIVLNKGCKSGEMTVDGVSYEFFTARSSDGKRIELRKGSVDDNDVGENFILWLCNTKLKNGLLYLTVTIDNVSDYEGKTIVLHPRSVEK